MLIGEFAGYLASLLVFAAFYMKTMVPLRIVGIGSNVAFITYSVVEGLIPVLLLHAALLPLNIIRLHQLTSLVRELRGRSDMSLESLLPFMTRRRFRAGDTLFRKGDEAYEMFFIRRGAVRLPEIRKTVEVGDVLGEISMFSPDKRRTSSAVADSDGELLCLSDGDVTRLYYQNPGFGLYIIRLITGRLIENSARLDEAVPAPAPYLLPEPAPGGTGRGDAPAGRGRARRFRATWAPHLGAVALVAVALALYAGWTLAPYVSSALFRDAALTTWIHVATAPLRGNLDQRLPAPGQRVGEDGRLATVRDLQADRSQVDLADAEVVRAEARVAELRDFLATIEQLDEEWRDRSVGYASVFKDNLDTEIRGLERELAFLTRRLKLDRALADRRQTLAQGGDSPQALADEAMAAVMELERLRAEQEMHLEHAKERRQAAERGVFLLSNGRNPEWAYQSRDQLRVDIADTRHALAGAEADLAEARAAAAAVREAFDLARTGAVEAPPGSKVWSVIAGPGAAVATGTPVAEWIDCGVMLVDVPASDIEVGLLRAGMPADVLFEGERTMRRGAVLLTRGSSASLDDTDLAAARSRDAGTGQVIVRLEAEPEDVAACRIGTAAWVDFPDVGIFDLLRARLRL